MGDQDKRDSAKGKPSRSAGGRAGASSEKGRRSSGAKLSGSNVGRVLRTAYDDALREAVPDEFLNLLGKLE